MTATSGTPEVPADALRAAEQAAVTAINEYAAHRGATVGAQQRVIDGLNAMTGVGRIDLAVRIAQAAVAGAFPMTDQPTIDPDAAAELAAYRAGCCQLDWDQHTADSPHHTSYGYGTDEPTTYVQHTYDGRPAWLCSVCMKVTLAADVADGAACRGCGSVDTLGALLYAELCNDETHEH